MQYKNKSDCLTQIGEIHIKSRKTEDELGKRQFEVNRNRQSADFEVPAPSLEDGGAVSKREYLRHQKQKQTTTCRGACD
jgi:hypothetical protein